MGKPKAVLSSLQSFRRLSLQKKIPVQNEVKHEEQALLDSSPTVRSPVSGYANADDRDASTLLHRPQQVDNQELEAGNTTQRRGSKMSLPTPSMSSIPWLSTFGTLAPKKRVSDLPILNKEANSALLQPRLHESNVHIFFYGMHKLDAWFSVSDLDARVHLVDIVTGESLTASQAVCIPDDDNPNSYAMVHFDMPAADLLSPRVLILVELFYAVPAMNSFSRLESNNDSIRSISDGTDGFTYHCKEEHVGWAFLRPINDAGEIVPESLIWEPSDENRTSLSNFKLYLQVYKRQNLTWPDMAQARAKWSIGEGVDIPSVYLQYLKRSKVDMPLVLPISCQASHNTYSLSTSYLPHQGELPGTSPNGSPKNAMQVLKENDDDALSLYHRQDGEPCLLPHRVLCQFPSTAKGTCKLTFSSSGNLLAVAGDCGNGDYPIYLYDVVHGKVNCVARGHRGFIRAIQWEPGSNERFVSSSDDGTGRLWQVEDDSNSVIEKAIWVHQPAPCIVHCILFDPRDAKFVFTGASDWHVRVWRTDVQDHFTEVMRWKVGKQAINSIQIHAASNRVFCGDAHGAITIWSLSTPSNDLNRPTLLKHIDAGGGGIMNFQLHPRRQHLLVYTLNGSVLQFELRSYLLLHRRDNLSSPRGTNLECNYSPDGKYTCIDTDVGAPVLVESLRDLPEVDDKAEKVTCWNTKVLNGVSLVKMAWSPSAHIVAAAGYGANTPIVLLCAHRQDARTSDVNTQSKNINAWQNTVSLTAPNAAFNNASDEGNLGRYVPVEKTL